MRLQAVQNNKQNVHFQKLGANHYFIEHKFGEAVGTGKELLAKLNADSSLKGVKGHIEHSGSTNFIDLKKGWFVFKKKAEGIIIDKEVTFESLKAKLIEVSSKLSPKK